MAAAMLDQMGLQSLRPRIAAATARHREIFDALSAPLDAPGLALRDRADAVVLLERLVRQLVAVHTPAPLADTVTALAAMEAGLTEAQALATWLAAPAE